jgi:hypothetical protein
MIWLALAKTLLVKVVRSIVGEAGGAGDIPLDITELSRVAEDALRPHGPPEPSQPLPYSEVERQRAQAASAARPETARPPPLPEPLCPICEHTLGDHHTCEPRESEFPATFPVTELAPEPSSASPFPDTLRPVALRTADTVRPPRPRMPRSAQRAAKRLPPPPRK